MTEEKRCELEAEALIAILDAERGARLAAERERDEERERGDIFAGAYARCGQACGESSGENSGEAAERVVRERDEALAALAALREAAQAVFARYVLTATTTEIVREMAELGAALAATPADLAAQYRARIRRGR